ncbi:hypothetical protein QJS04_geneDACA011348 [Acorus gramineus]|uniref:Uncharacterized protein n=1 Tax=Acorus gramineus TaxID=55184 RepID=A0AAV9ALT1_ACOGR|nr:hypothetical protein QJS04_geneDACA011348 [Acorus gramineus]
MSMLPLKPFELFFTVQTQIIIIQTNQPTEPALFSLKLKITDYISSKIDLLHK